MNKIFAALAVLLLAISPAFAEEGTTRITETPQVSQPGPFSKSGETVVVPRTRIEIDEGKRKATPTVIAGIARIIDGDTIELSGYRIRLHGIDAPETNQTCWDDQEEIPCGKRSSHMLSTMTQNQKVTCNSRGRDKYGRVLAVCFVGEVDINSQMVRDGWALAYRQYSSDYAAEETQAKRFHNGLWKWRFTPPWKWRAMMRSDVADPECQIKGNISRKGERIYHLPGGQYYDRTKIDAAKGERWFCSEDEARAAGWRKSKR